jgi:hypothetical protein
MRTIRGILQDLERDARHMMKGQSFLYRKLTMWSKCGKTMGDESKFANPGKKDRRTGKDTATEPSSHRT